MKKLSEILGKKEKKANIFHPFAHEIVDEPLPEMAWGAMKIRNYEDNEYQVVYLEKDATLSDFPEREYFGKCI